MTKVSKEQAEGFVSKSCLIVKSSQEDLVILKNYLKNLIDWFADNNKRNLWKADMILSEIRSVSKKIKELELWFPENQSQNIEV